MAKRKHTNCCHILANGAMCEAVPLRDSNFCYWHHRARARRRHYQRIAGPLTAHANSGIELPLLEDPNAIQIAIQEIMQAILDCRIDNKRAGLLLYSIQLASSNVRRLKPIADDDSLNVESIGDDTDSGYNNTIEDDDRDEYCDGDCQRCTEEDCEVRDAEPIPLPVQRKPKPQPAAAPEPSAPPKKRPATAAAEESEAIPKSS